MKSYEIWAKVSNVGAVLGSGSYGSVAQVEYDGRPACLKEGKDNRDLSVFHQEAKMLTHLDGIGGAPILFAVASDQPIIVMSFCKGKTVLDLFNDDDTPFWTWLNILKGIVHKVSQIHSHNVMHNDLKLNNVIVDREELEVSVIDFGLASFSGLNSRFPTGTKESYKRYKHYAPELYLDGLSSAQSDTWSLGVIIDKILMGVDIDSDLVGVTDSLKTLVRDMKCKDMLCRPSLQVVYDKLSDSLDSCLDILSGASSPPSESPLNSETDSACSDPASETGVFLVDKHVSACGIELVIAEKRKRDSDDAGEVGVAKRFRDNDTVCVIPSDV